MSKINVLSLFDGMSCGRIALDRLGVDVGKYYASEIDKYAMQIAKKNYPDTVHLGNVLGVKGENLEPIDLLIGGSPCQGFSSAGKNLNFKDPRSRLFFEYVRLLKETKPRYFLLENVSMKREHRDIISNQLGVEPIAINSTLVTPQKRLRYYWTNLPTTPLPQKKYNLKFKGDLGRRVGRRLLNGVRKDYDRTIPIIQRVEINANPLISNCLTTVAKDNILVTEGGFKPLGPKDYERLQTVPLGYTEGVSDTQRLKMLGNGWTVEVIEHLFRGLLQ